MNSTNLDVLIVGAGAAGVGMGVALRHAGVERMLLVDRFGVGASFERWPREMRFITPSFATNSIGMLDINSIAVGSSPAYILQTEHPSGQQYAAYLQGVAQFFQLPVRKGVDVQSVASEDGGLVVTTSQGVMCAQHVVWAAGEFQYPELQPFPGAEHCRHNATIPSWSSVEGDRVAVIGGYESGLDAAIHLAKLGKQVVVLDRQQKPPWRNEASDPSLGLSAYTVDRFQDPEVHTRVKLVEGAEVFEVRRGEDGLTIFCVDGGDFTVPTPPILATGFRGSTQLVAELFERRDDGFPLLNERDESTLTPGLFLSGPMVRHDRHVFCFIYKFRQRFAVVARTIAERLGHSGEALEGYRQWGMYLDDLSCCGEECVC